MNKDPYSLIVQHLVDNQALFYRLAYSYTQNKESALDIVQNAICKALENYTSLRNVAFVKTWFYRILVNESLNYIKKNKKELPCDSNDMKETPYLENAYEPQDDLYERIQALSPEIQIIIKLHYFEDFTLKEISTITNTNLSTVKTRLYTGLKKLKIQLKEDSDDERI